MSSGERETGVLVFRHGVVRLLEGSPIVTLFAAVAPRSCRELALVFVLVAIQALRKLDLVSSIFACRNVARFALHCCMRKSEREFSLSMIRGRESGGLPALHRVAAFASAFVGALKELPAMRIGLMAIGTIVVRDWRLEIARLVTGFAGYLDMLAKQGEVRFGVVEG